jgi:hypothetical protein
MFLTMAIGVSDSTKCRLYVLSVVKGRFVDFKLGDYSSDAICNVVYSDQRLRPEVDYTPPSGITVLVPRSIKE